MAREESEIAERSSPEILVLGGGGVLGEAWMSSVLAGLDEAQEFDSLACRAYIGTSAGSIVAASLAAGARPGDRLGTLPEQPAAPEAEADAIAPLRALLDVAARAGGSAAAPFVSLALSSTAVGGAMLRRAALRRVSRGSRSLSGLGRLIERSGASWDGRLRVVAVDLDSGRRVVFGAAGAPEVSVPAAVQASCAIPGVFRPVQAGGRSYVDGGVWSPTNMDVAEVGRGDRVMCLNPTASLRPARGAMAGALGQLSRAIATAEALVLERRGARVSTIGPDAACARIMGVNLMDPSRREAVIEAGLAQGRTLAARGRLRAA
jgi:NTE family protein